MSINVKSQFVPKSQDPYLADYSQLPTKALADLLALFVSKERVGDYEALPLTKFWLADSDKIVSIAELQRRVDATNRWIKWQYAQINPNLEDVEYITYFNQLDDESDIDSFYVALTDYFELFNSFPSDRGASRLGTAFQLTHVLRFLNTLLANHPHDGEPIVELDF